MTFPNPSRKTFIWLVFLCPQRVKGSPHTRVDGFWNVGPNGIPVNFIDVGWLVAFSPNASKSNELLQTSCDTALSNSSVITNLSDIPVPLCDIIISKTVRVKDKLKSGPHGLFTDWLAGWRQTEAVQEANLLDMWFLNPKKETATLKPTSVPGNNSVWVPTCVALSALCSFVYTEFVHVYG